MAVIENAKKDTVFEVRSAAHAAAFTATGRMDNYVIYLIRLREDPPSVLAPLPADAKTREHERVLRNLVHLASTTRVTDLAKNHPDRMADLLMSLLEDRSPVMRRGAIRLLPAAMVEPLAPRKEIGFIPLPPFEAPPSRARGKAAPHFEKKGITKRLQTLSRDDPDASVRESAQAALDLIATFTDKPQGDPEKK